VQERTAALVELLRSGHAAQLGWNRFERVRVLDDEGVTEQERANH